MRSTTPSTRRLHHRAPRHDLLPAVAGIVDQATLDDPGHVLVHIAGPSHPEVSLGLRSLEPGLHPFEVLAGFTAPVEWSAFGIRARGRARHLDQPGRPSSPTAMTFLLDRRGAEASVLRLDGEVSEPPGPAVGTVPDLCRRVLGMATEPAPASTLSLWTTIWLDRVLEAWGQPARRRQVTSSWDEIARLHPAVHASSPEAGTFADPAALVAAARSHAAATSWNELRRDPSRVALPEGPVDAAVALWMDDGFFARWTIGAFPSSMTMTVDLRELLGDPMGPTLLEVAQALSD